MAAEREFCQERVELGLGDLTVGPFLVNRPNQLLHCIHALLHSRVDCGDEPIDGYSIEGSELTGVEELEDIFNQLC